MSASAQDETTPPARVKQDELLTHSRRLWLEGKDTAQIAQELGVHEYKIANRMELIRMPHHGSYDQSRALRVTDDREACILHLQDIYREHSYNKRWKGSRVLRKPLRPFSYYSSLNSSSCGSPSAMCVEL